MFVWCTESSSYTQASSQKALPRVAAPKKAVEDMHAYVLINKTPEENAPPHSRASLSHEPNRLNLPSNTIKSSNATHETDPKHP